MADFFKDFAEGAELGFEVATIVCLLLGGIAAIGVAGKKLIQGKLSAYSAKKDIWLRFAAWTLLALEFALAADIVHTAISPDWDDIGHLAAIAVIRSVLNYLLERDLEKYAGQEHADAKAKGDA